MPEWVQINAIEPSPFDPATAYVAATMYKSDDFKPYMYKTTDYGKTWTKIVNGIPNDHFTRVRPRRSAIARACCSPERNSAFMFRTIRATTGSRSSSTCPSCRITDLGFHKRDDELVVATQGPRVLDHGRSRLLWDLKGQAPSDDIKIFKPKTTLRAEGGGRGGGGNRPPSAASARIRPAAR